MPLIRIRDLLQSKIETYYKGPFDPQFIVNKGDVLIGMDGDFHLVEWKNESALLNQRVLKVSARQGGKIKVDFIKHWLVPQLVDINGKTAATTVKHLSTASLSDISVALPDLGQQAHIALVLDACSTQIETTEALIAKHQQIKAGLMHDLFTRGILEDGTMRPAPQDRPDLYCDGPWGQMAKDWTIRQIEDMCAAIADCPHSTPKYIEGGVPCIRTADLVPGNILLDQAYTVSEREHYLRSERLVLKIGDVIYSREGERLGIAGPVESEPICMGQRVMALRASAENDGYYLMSVMNHAVFYRKILSGLGATTSPHVNVADIRKAKVPVPTPNEQRRIAGTLRTCEARLRQEQTSLEKNKALKLGLMKSLLNPTR